MRNDIPRNRLHGKMFGKQMEELQNSLPHQLYTSICCVFRGNGGPQIRIYLFRNSGSKDAHGKLRDFVRLCGFLQRNNAGKHEYIGMCMRDNGTICPCSFSQVLQHFSRQNWTFPFKTKCFWSVEKAMMCVEKDKRRVWAGPINNRNAYCCSSSLQNKGKTHKTTIGLITGIGLKLDQNCFYTGKKRQKDKLLHFHAATVLGFLQAKSAGDVTLPKHINAGRLIYLRFMKHKMLDF